MTTTPKDPTDQPRKVGAPPEDSQDCLAGALACAERGFRVFPLKGKHPSLKNWQEIATTDPTKIRQLWRQFPGANVGIVCGQSSGIWVLDADPRHGGDEALRLLINENGPLPETLQVMTGGGGSHRYFAHPGFRVPNSAGKVGDGLDVRGDGGLVAAPPSLHESGRRYVWDGLVGIDAPIAPAPEWLVLLACDNERAGGDKPPLDVPGEIREGQRNDWLYKYCCSLRGAGGGMDLTEIIAAASAMNQARCKPPLGQDEVRATAENACRHPKGGKDRGPVGNTASTNTAPQEAPAAREGTRQQPRAASEPRFFSFYAEHPATDTEPATENNKQMRQAARELALFESYWEKHGQDNIGGAWDAFDKFDPITRGLCRILHATDQPAEPNTEGRDRSPEIVAFSAVVREAVNWMRTSPSPEEAYAQLQVLLAQAQDTNDAEPLFEATVALRAISDGQFSNFQGLVKEATKKSALHIDIDLLKKARRGAAKLQAIDGGAPALAKDSGARKGHSYEQRNGCIVRTDSGKDRSETISLTNFTARVTAETVEDDGAEERKVFEVDAWLHGRRRSFSVPSPEFDTLGWVTDKLGAGARVFPNQKEWARDGIKALSEDSGILERRIYTHTGWRQVDGRYVYLHAGGAIGADGSVSGIETHLSGTLANFVLIPPESREALVKAIRASLQVLDVAPDHISVPLLAAVYRACIRVPDFGLWIVGKTGLFKSELAALAQRHYGAAMDSRALPANFASTGNFTEMAAFGAKDAVLVVDDFAPHGGAQEISRYYATADRLLRASGNNQARGRLTADGKLRPPKPPRSLILATGEDLPRGQSIRARTFIIEVAEGDVNLEVLTKCQENARLFSTSLAGFVQWHAGAYESTYQEFMAWVTNLRSQGSGAHARTPGIVADLYGGIHRFLAFAVEMDAITVEEADKLRGRSWEALKTIAKEQGVQQRSSDPALRFLTLLRAAIRSGEAHVATLAGKVPEDGLALGWHEVGLGQNSRLEGRGRCVGWTDDKSNLYLEPTATYALAQELARKTTEPLAISETTLGKRLNDAKLLESIDRASGSLKVRRHVQGRVTKVWHLRMAILGDEE